MSDDGEPVYVLLRPWDQTYLQTWKKFLCTSQGDIIGNFLLKTCTGRIVREW